MTDPGPASRSERLSVDDTARQVASSLEEDIVLGRLYPNQKLVEDDIAARFETKRHVVREAFAELERLGLVERVRNRGAYVRLYGIEEVQEINALRELLEAGAASAIPLPVEESTLSGIADIQQAHACAARSGDVEAAFRLNLRFHRALFSICGNRALVEAIETWAQRSHAYRSILVADRDYLAWAAEDHRKMVDALRSSDRKTLVSLCRDHLAPARDRYVETYRARFGGSLQDHASRA